MDDGVCAMRMTGSFRGLSRSGWLTVQSRSAVQTSVDGESPIKLRDATHSNYDRLCGITGTRWTYVDRQFSLDVI